jgi:CheY-like chemotaxis protein
MTSAPPNLPLMLGRVLVVEDDPGVQQVLNWGLRRAGVAEVHVASDGLTGLELARTLLLDLIVSDVMLPGISGIEMVRRLRAEHPRLQTPVVFLTAAFQPAFGDRPPSDFGALGALQKPVPIRQLGPLLAELMRGAG